MPKLPLRTKIYYGMAALTMNLPDLIVMQWLLMRYVPPNAGLLVPAKLFGLLFLCGRITDGVSCSMIAHWSDVCQSRWGRRLPFMRIGILPFALVFFLLFMPPVGHEHWLNAVHAFVFIQGYFILYGVIVTPYLALMPEITSDLKERVDLTTAQSIFMVIATVLFTLAGIVLENYGWFAFAAGAALLIVVFFLPAVFRLKEAPTQAAAPEDNLSYLQSLWLAFRNRPCRYVIFSTALYWFGLNGMIALVPHWTIRYLGRTEEDVTKLMVPFVVVNVIFFFVFNALAPKVGKYRLMLATFLGSGLVMMSLCLVGYIPFGSDFAQSVVVFALFAAPVAGFMVLPFAVLGDVIDNDAQQTGRRREAIFFGVQGIFQKTMIGVSIMTFTTVTTIGGQGGATPFGLKLMAFLCGLSCIAAFFLFLGYPLREDRGRAIMQGQS